MSFRWRIASKKKKEFKQTNKRELLKQNKVKHTYVKLGVEELISLIRPKGGFDVLLVGRFVDMHDNLSPMT